MGSCGGGGGQRVGVRGQEVGVEKVEGDGDTD